MFYFRFLKDITFCSLKIKYIISSLLVEIKFNGAYWIIQQFLVHYQILHILGINIAKAILDFTLLLPIKISLFQLLRQHIVVDLTRS